MKNLSAFIVRIKKLEDIDDAVLEVFLRDYMSKNFEESECEERMLFDEDRNVLIAFMPDSYKYKLDGFVELAEEIHPTCIEQYEDVTNKFLHQNDYSDYDVKSEKINQWIFSNLNKDDVLDKMGNIGIELTEIDHQVLRA